MKINTNHARFINWIAPLLEVLKEKGGSATIKEVRDGIAKKMNLNDAVLSERRESGVLKFYDEVSWAKQYLSWENLVSVSKHGVWALTDEGWKASYGYDDALALSYKWVEAHRGNRKKRKSQDKPAVRETNKGEVEPELKKSVSLMELLKKTTPTGFEHLCGRLLREYDFESIEITKRSHDGGFDGSAILKLNPFVKMSVYFECKRYDGTVPIEKIRAFVGVLSTERRADKGIFITTGSFTAEAYRLEEKNTKLELIDGEKLVEMFEKANLGVKPQIVYEPDPAFFRQYIDKGND